MPSAVSLPWLFLAVAIFRALLTLNALSPFRRVQIFQVPWFFAAWLTKELAPHYLLWQMVVTAWFLWEGAARAAPGQVALGLCCVSFVGLARLIVDARKAEGTMESALREALGDAYRTAIPGDLSDPLDEPFLLRQRLLPIPIFDGRVERVRNIVYAEAAGRSLRLDVYRKRGDRPAKSPTLLFLHGGAWIIGRKDDQGLPLMLRLASHGWVCISAQYRLSPRATFPDHLIDVKSAIRWIREHGAEVGADPDFVVISGGSAGGHLAALAALTPNEPEYQPGFEGVDTRVQACVPFYGVYDFTDRRGFWKGSLLPRLLERAIMKRSRKDAFEAFDRASPMSRVNPDAPPFFVVHGTHDTVVPVADARTFVELLRASSKAEVAYAEIPGAQHAFEVFPSVRTERAIRGVERFLAWIYARHRAKAGERALPAPKVTVGHAAGSEARAGRVSAAG